MFEQFCFPTWAGDIIVVMVIRHIFAALLFLFNFAKWNSAYYITREKRINEIMQAFLSEMKWSPTMVSEPG